MWKTFKKTKKNFFLLFFDRKTVRDFRIISAFFKIGLKAEKLV
ncbi:hypothetical protein U719_14475 [Exiguobacterium sp. MH3]|nr:hypothetical protein U719_14475 [Exiguobacterium sp. MH3]